VRNLGRAEEVRATIGKVTANAGAIEFAAAALNSDAGWANAVAGADFVLHVASPVPAVDPKSDDDNPQPSRGWRAVNDRIITLSAALLAF
jgi:dihydroflavonol-4-reductase